VDYLTEQDIDTIDNRCSLKTLGDEYVKRHRNEVSGKVSKFASDPQYGWGSSTMTEWMHHGIKAIIGHDSDPLPRGFDRPNRIVGIGAEGGDLEGTIVLAKEEQDNPKPAYHWLRELTEVQIAIEFREHRYRFEDEPDYAECCQRRAICEDDHPWGDETLRLLRKWLYETTPYTIWSMYEKCQSIMEEYLYSDGLFTEIAMGFTDNVDSMTQAVSESREQQMTQWMKDNV